MVDQPARYQLRLKTMLAAEDRTAASEWAPVALALCLALALATPARATDFLVVPIVDTTAPIPGGSGPSDTITNILVPTLDGTESVFWAEGANQHGLYRHDIYFPEAISIVVDTNTPIPGGTGNFLNITKGVYGFDDGYVAFIGEGSGGQEGVYISSGSPPQLVADKSTAVPGGGTFADFTYLWTCGGNVAFYAAVSGGNSGIFTNLGGPLRKVVDTTDPVPGGAGTLGLRPYFSLSMEGSGILFIADTGIYLERLGVVSKVVDLNDLTPSGLGTFTSFAFPHPPLFDGDGFVFKARDENSGQGIYRSDSGVVTVVVDANTQLPGYPGVANYPVNHGVSNGAFSLQMDGDVPLGIYTTLGGSLSRIVDNNSLLLGLPHAGVLGTYAYGIDGGVFVFNANGWGPDELDVTMLVTPSQSAPALSWTFRLLMVAALITLSFWLLQSGLPRLLRGSS